MLRLIYDILLSLPCLGCKARILTHQFQVWFHYPTCARVDVEQILQTPEYWLTTLKIKGKKDKNKKEEDILRGISFTATGLYYMYYTSFFL